MKNIYLVRTTDVSVLSKAYLANPSNLRFNPNGFPYDSYRNNDNQHLYITSEDAIKFGEWYLDTFKNEVRKAMVNLVENAGGGKYFKIIMSTDPDLTDDGIQRIDEGFLKWFVNNSDCEEVEIEITRERNGYKSKHKKNYKIKFPKPEPLDYEQFRMKASPELLKEFDHDCLNYSEDADSDSHFYANCKYWESRFLSEQSFKATVQPDAEILTYTEAAKKEERIFNSTMQSKPETLEQAAKNISELGEYDRSLESTRKNYFIKGANWQKERSYTPEQVILLIQFLTENPEFASYSCVSKETAEYFLKEFKKK